MEMISKPKIRIRKPLTEKQKIEGKESFRAWRKRDSLKKRIDKIIKDLEALTDSEVKLIFAKDEYVKKVLEIGGKALDIAEWKPSEGKIGLMKLKTIPNLKQRKNEKKWIPPLGFELEDKKNILSKLNVKEGALLDKKKDIDREFVLQKHLSELIKHYLSADEIEAHKQLKLGYGFPDTLRNRMFELETNLENAKSENARLKEFLKSNNLEAEYKAAEKLHRYSEGAFGEGERGSLP